MIGTMSVDGFPAAFSSADDKETNATANRFALPSLIATPFSADDTNANAHPDSFALLSRRATPSTALEARFADADAAAANCSNSCSMKNNAVRSTGTNYGLFGLFRSDAVSVLLPGALQHQFVFAVAGHVATCQHVLRRRSRCRRGMCVCDCVVRSCFPLPCWHIFVS